jgi:hypothetical protein
MAQGSVLEADGETKTKADRQVVTLRHAGLLAYEAVMRIPFAALFITAVFVWMKLDGVIKWSWFWVLSPTWSVAFGLLATLGIIWLMNRR